MSARSALASGWAWTNGTLLRQAVGGLALAGLIIGVVVVVSGGDEPTSEATGPGATATTAGPAEPGEPATTAAGAETTTTTIPPTTPPPPAPEQLQFLPEDQPDNGSVAPLTGLPVLDPGLLGRAALAVKIDNLDTPGETAVPQTGLAFADLVVEEVVEGGITGASELRGV